MYKRQFLGRPTVIFPDFSVPQAPRGPDPRPVPGAPDLGKKPVFDENGEISQVEKVTFWVIFFELFFDFCGIQWGHTGPYQLFLGRPTVIFPDFSVPQSPRGPDPRPVPGAPDLGETHIFDENGEISQVEKVTF